MSSLLTSPVPPAKTSSQAVWSLVLGILSMTCLWLAGAIPAILLGIFAMRNIDRSGGTLKGRGLGIAGIVTGSIGIFTGVFTLAILTSLALPAYNRANVRAKQSLVKSQVRQILIGCHSYASDHNDAFPESLAQLSEGGYLEPAILESKQGIAVGFLYRPGFSLGTPVPEPCLASSAPLGNQRIVGLTDGSVHLIGEETFQADYALHFP